MKRLPAGFPDKRTEADFFREASLRLGISPDWLATAASASRLLTGEEREVLIALLGLVGAGIPAPRRSAVSRGILSAIKTIQEADGDDDPLAEVDEPMDTAEAAQELVLAEAESQAHREAILQQCISVGEAAALTGRSRQALERLRRRGGLLALRQGNQWRYPRWQFDADAPGGVVPGLGEVLCNLQLSPAGAAFWLLEPYERLGGTPAIELLRRRRSEPVIQLALEHSYMP